MNYGRYEIIKELGHGSMGVVYQARDPHIDRLIAVKVMRRDRMANESFVKRFMKEARVIGRLSHPRIVTIYDVGEEHGEIYIAMEFLEGTSLADVIREKRPDAKEIAELGIQIAETLDYAHRKGVVHRDIKPSNIIVEPDGQVRITDFGIARIEDPSATLQTQTGEIMGTPAYMSPEQVLGSQVDGRSDIFSLGVILYELSTGRRPFGGEGKTLATVFNDITGVIPQDPHSAAASIPVELSGIIMKALAKDPAQRFQSGKEMAEALGACLAKPDPAPVAVTPAQKKSPNYAVPLVAAMLLAAVIGGGYFLYRGRQTPPPNHSPQAEANPPDTARTNPPSLPPETQSDTTLPSSGPGNSPAETEKPATSPPVLPPQQNTNPRGQEQAQTRAPPPATTTPKPKPATLAVRTTPPGAVIHIDGKTRGTAPLTLTLPKGAHRVRASLAGYERMEKRIVLEESKRYPLTLELKTIAESDEWVVNPLVDRPRE